MAVIHNVQLRSGEFDVTVNQLESIVQWVREAVADDMWRWFEEHKDDKILTVRKWIFNYTFYVHHLESVFELLFGPRSH